MRQNTDDIHIHTEQIKAIKANDDKVIKAFYSDNYLKIEQYVIKNNGSAEEAKDIYQEAFIAVWRNIQLDKFQPENETSLAGYLYRIAKNKWMDHLRSSHFKKVIPLNDDVETEHEEAIGKDENEYIMAVKKNFKNLGDKCREVLTRFYYHHEPLKVIAQKFDWTEATARNNKYRCLQQLREFIKNK